MSQCCSHWPVKMFFCGKKCVKSRKYVPMIVKGLLLKKKKRKERNWSFVGICAKTLAVNQWGCSSIIYIFGTHFCDKHWKMLQQNDVLWEHIKKEAQSKADKATVERPWKDETHLQLITLTPHSRCLLLYDFLPHAVPESSFNMSLSTVTARRLISKQFATCVNYHPGTGWVGLGARECYSKECLRWSTSPRLVVTASRAGPRCLTLEWSLCPTISSSFTTSPPTYGSTFACAFQCVCNSFLASSSPPHLSETCPFKATTSPLQLIVGSPWRDGGKVLCNRLYLAKRHKRGTK